jgi:hypothetical protein
VYDYSSSIRQINGLRWAREYPAGPFGKPAALPELGTKRARSGAAPRAVGSKGAGLRYERVVGNAIATLLPQTRRGVWHQFSDSNGLGWCQPDLLSVVFAPSQPKVGAEQGTPPTVQSIEIVWECKLTYNPAALAQLTGLYLPVRQSVQSAPVIGIVVCRSLTPAVEKSRIVYSVAEALGVAQSGQIPVLLWLGRGRFPLQ